jgi:hypothetical protein
VGVPGQGEPDLRRHVGKNIRRVAQQQDRLFASDFCKGRLQVVGLGHRVREAGDPQRLRAGFDPFGRILKHRDPLRRQQAPHLGTVPPPVVVAEHGVDPQGGLEPAQNRRRVVGIDEAARKPAFAHVIAQQQDEVAALGVQTLDDGGDALQGFDRRSGLQVAHDDHAQLPLQAGERHAEARHHQRPRLDPEGVDCQRQAH